MTIRIDRIETQIIDHPLRKQQMIISAAGQHAFSCYLQVTLHGQGGLCGYGEAATVPIWSGESAQTAEWMVNELLAPKLTGATFGHPREALAVMDKATVGNPFAKSALDTALWDLWAKQQNVNVMTLFGDHPPLPEVPSRASIGAYSPEKTAALAKERWDQGIRTLKLKVAVPGIDDVARTRAVRELLGKDVVLHADANGGYPTVYDAVRATDALRAEGVTLMEQPTPRDRIGMLAQVKKRVSIPIMADEAVFTPDHLQEALACDAFDVLNVYPGKNGGFTHTLDMAKAVAAAGKTCIVGSNLETDLGQAAMVSLAAALSVFDAQCCASDLAAALHYPTSSITAPLRFERGALHTPTGIGFGVTPVQLEKAAHG